MWNLLTFLLLMPFCVVLLMLALAFKIAENIIELLLIYFLLGVKTLSMIH